MYALYVKNKPSSDRLLAECGNFFHEKQKELNDKMDLASYLLKPVQRLTKYALFIDGISKNENGTEKRDLKRAQNLIEFQVCQFSTLENFSRKNEHCMRLISLQVNKNKCTKFLGLAKRKLDYKKSFWYLKIHIKQKNVWVFRIFILFYLKFDWSCDNSNFERKMYFSCSPSAEFLIF